MKNNSNKTQQEPKMTEWEKEMQLESRERQKDENQYESEYRTPSWDFMEDVESIEISRHRIM